MNILQKIQNLPEPKRKMILWIVVIIIGLGLLSWWVKNLEMKIKSFKLEKIKEELRLPKLEVLKKFEEILKAQ